MEQQERATPRIIGALVARDAGCALRNPTVLLCAAVAAAFSWLFGATLADELTATPGFAVFLMAFAAILPTLEAGGVVTLFAMSEEDADDHLRRHDGLQARASTHHDVVEIGRAHV